MNVRIFIATLIAGSCFFSCTPDPEPPNILFVIADDASFPHMSAYGTSWIHTPGFDRVAREGILFMNAYTPNAKCSPSRSCILTGRNSWQLEEAANHIPDFPAKFTSVMEVFQANGYKTGYTGKGWSPGNAGEMNGKPRQLTGPGYQEFKTTPPAEHISHTDYAANFKAFLEEKADTVPFFFWYGGTEPHRRYEYGAGIAKGGKRTDQILKVPEFWPDTDTVRTDMLDYAYEIEYFDSHLETMLQILEEAGELENTLVVVTSDNGMPFPRVKGNAYELSNHMPLAMMWPRGIADHGRKEEAFVSFIDFAPTFLEIADIPIETTTMAPVEGHSLTDLFTLTNKYDKPNRSYVLIGKERHDLGRPNDAGYPIRGIVRDGYLYLRNYTPDRWPAGNPETGYLNTDGGATKTQILNYRYDSVNRHYWQINFGKRPAEELYDLSADPDCLHNLASNPEFSQVRESLQQQMMQELRRQKDPRVLGNGNIFDEYPYAHGGDFYTRFMEGDTLNHGWINESDFQAPED